MSIIRAAVVDAPVTGLINTTNNFDFELQLCRKSSDKPVYSKFQIVSLVDFDINISASLSHVINKWSVLYTLFTLRSSPFITLWTPDDFICLGGGCLLYYMYARIARATFHLKGQDNRSYPSLASSLPKGKLNNPGYYCSDKRRYDPHHL
jgi:hypothetical protein